MRTRVTRFAAWLGRWRAIAPLVAAEMVLWVGFGALLPVMPIYFTQHDVDIAALGLVVAAWPAARLVAEPVFGWLADRWPRVPFMVVGLLVSGSAVGLALIWTGLVPFVILRALAGAGTAMFDPAARGWISDSAPPERRGEAFGLYSSGSTLGLLLGPAFGGLGASAFGGIAFVFGFSALASFVAAATVALRVREVRRVHPGPEPLPATLAEFPGGGDAAARASVANGAPGGPVVRSLANRFLFAAIVFNLGQYLAGGIYEVVWSLFLTWRGGGLDLVGLTFAMWSIPVIVLSPLAGRWVDRRGSFGFIVAGAVATVGTMVAYPLVTDLWQVIPLIMIEASGYALLSPALYSLVAIGAPPGRSSMAQGIFGASGTVGTIAAAILAGILAASDLRLPFWFGAAAFSVLLVAGVVVGGGRVRRLGGRLEAAS